MRQQWLSAYFQLQWDEKDACPCRWQFFHAIIGGGLNTKGNLLAQIFKPCQLPKMNHNPADGFLADAGVATEQFRSLAQVDILVDMITDGRTQVLDLLIQCLEYVCYRCQGIASQLLREDPRDSLAKFA